MPVWHQGRLMEKGLYSFFQRWNPPLLVDHGRRPLCWECGREPASAPARPSSASHPGCRGSPNDLRCPVAIPGQSGGGLPDARACLGEAALRLPDQPVSGPRTTTLDLAQAHRPCSRALGASKKARAQLRRRNCAIAGGNSTIFAYCTRARGRCLLGDCLAMQALARK